MGGSLGNVRGHFCDIRRRKPFGGALRWAASPQLVVNYFPITYCNILILYSMGHKMKVVQIRNVPAHYSCSATSLSKSYPLIVILQLLTAYKGVASLGYSIFILKAVQISVAIKHKYNIICVG